ncbi:MAG: undecaprenyldiphospho-muramoylpentapeptide beta-N-acetylglucosaminyltransferase [Polyangiaceae bacterium]|nr:undecaprenyldiphospho-muramoylpentapeptide beta-N-acetylglucosaminyltransferase [Polyangiaceae bacterium]
MTTVLIAGGGTGGHVFPMVAVGDALLAARSDVRVVYVGTARGLESKICGERGDHLELLNVAPLRGGGIKGFARGVGRAFAVLPEARALVKKLGPSVCLSVGGYAGGPVALAARTLGVPVAILEPNSVLGLTNKLLSPMAVRAYTAFPETERFLRPSVIRRMGVPLRRAFAAAPYKTSADKLSILVIGGSQGARFFNETVPQAVALAAEKTPNVDVRVLHQTGKDSVPAVEQRYRDAGAEARATVTPFIADVATALAEADLVIARCGASSCAELCAVGRPGIFIPFPFAADNHQWRNAKSLENVGAVVALAQADATPETLASKIAELAADPSRRAKMADAAASLGKPHAAAEIAADLLTLVRSEQSVHNDPHFERTKREGGVLRIAEAG